MKTKQNIKSIQHVIEVRGTLDMIVNVVVSEKILKSYEAFETCEQFIWKLLSFYFLDQKQVFLLCQISIHKTLNRVGLNENNEDYLTTI